VLFLVAAFAMPAAAADMPSRKAGLWEITTHVANRPMTMQQCIDAATDQAMQSHASSSGANCSKRDVQKSAAGMTVDSVCTIAGKTMTSHIVVNGSFDSNYTMTITSEGGALPAAHHNARGQMARPLWSGSKARRHDAVERRQDKHRRYAEDAGAGRGARLALTDKLRLNHGWPSSIADYAAEETPTCG
jgi:hypothetical protein